MALISCPECGAGISEKAYSCPHCGHPLSAAQAPGRRLWGYEWRSQAEILGWPLIHIAIGRNKQTGKLLVAKGVIAIGQFGIGLITIAQFGIGILFAFGQFTGGVVAIGQFALGIYFGLGQFATGATAIGQFAVGKYVLAQLGFGEHVWSTKTKDPLAVEYFKNLWNSIRAFLGA
jgi:hypothetical protein